MGNKWEDKGKPKPKKPAPKKQTPRGKSGNKWESKPNSRFNKK